MESRYVTDQQQLLAQMAREGPENRRETSAVISPGGGVTVWAVRVQSQVSCNVYMVRTVVIRGTGDIPDEIGGPMEATNLAESFVTQGTLTPGTYALMCRMGEKNVFYAAP
jgi:hypothetical protein